MSHRRYYDHRCVRLLGVVLAIALVPVLGCMTNSARTPVSRTINPPSTPGGDAGPSGPTAVIDGAADLGPGPSIEGPTIDAGAVACPVEPGVRKNAGEPCVCDGQCATGFCQEGACCSGSTCGKRALGAPCQRPDQCDSGQCSDGVCCNVGCSGSCVSCNQPDRTGECMPVPAGQKDPREACRVEPAETCGFSGFCNGQGGCAKFAPGTACGVAACSGPRTFIPGGECDGEGLCVKGAPLECTPFTCENGNCRSSCVMDADCVPPNICSGGRCGLRGKGQTCTASEQCQSGFCVDGVCCESACTGRCQFCGSPANRGTCAPVRAGAPDPRAAAGVTDPALVCADQGVSTCGTNGRCDGRGGCQRYENGATCRGPRCETGANQETGASVCMGGSCRAPSAVSCAPFRGCTGNRCITQCGSDSQCASGFFCIDGSCGKRPTGGVCSRDTDCISTHCAQGRCCNVDCDATCMACNLAGSVGTCTPVMAGTEDSDCGDPRCTSCDGMGQCARNAGTVCQNTCAPGNTSRLPHVCDAEGACVPGTAEPCLTGQRCRMGVCACGPMETLCAGACTDFRSDPQHCGGCQQPCPTGAACVRSMCACPPGQTECGGACCDGTCTLGLCVPRVLPPLMP